MYVRLVAGAPNDRTPMAAASERVARDPQGAVPTGSRDEGQETVGTTRCASAEGSRPLTVQTQTSCWIAVSASSLPRRSVQVWSSPPPGHADDLGLGGVPFGCKGLSTVKLVASARGLPVTSSTRLTRIVSPVARMECGLGQIGTGGVANDEDAVIVAASLRLSRPSVFHPGTGSG